MAQFIDITGQQFNFLTVLRRNYDYVKIHNLSSTAAYWDCQCICGKIITVNGSQLRNGRKVSCGCIKRKLNDDIIQQRFGKLIVLERNYTYAKRHKVANDTSYYTCQCDCGKITTVSRKNLINGHTQSCGCLIAEKIFETNTTDLTNKKIGKLLVLARTEQKIPHGGYLWECQCDCGNITYVSSRSLLHTRVSSCGCLLSKGEEFIATYLRDRNIPFVQQYTFNDCLSPNGRKLRFDFFVSNQMLIEYDGSQHYNFTGYDWNTEENYQKTVINDKIKNEYCKNHNLKLIRIPYWDYDNLENILQNIIKELNIEAE